MSAFNRTLVWTAEIWPSATDDDIRDITERVYLATHEAVEGGYVPLSPLCGGFGVSEVNPRPGVCRHCGGDGRTLYFGSEPTADLIACPVCGDGRKLGDTDIPTARENNDGECAPHQFVHTPEDGVLCAACGKEGTDDDLA